MKLYTPMPALQGASRIFNDRRSHKGDAGPKLIYFWSMSCLQCKQSIEKLKEIHARFENRLAIHAIHMPRNDQDYSMEQLKDTIGRLQLPFPVYADHELKISDAFENLIVPAYYLFDEQQQLRFLKYGFLSTKLLQQKIERII